MADSILAAPSAEPDTVVHAASVQFAPFALPGFTGDTQAAFVNAGTAKAPLIALLKSVFA
jgi:hypothetical protein